MLRDCFKQELKRRKLGVTVRANKAGCLDQCELGPTVVIYPRQIWYGHVRPEDVARIVEETVIGGRVLEDLVIGTQWLNTKGRGPGRSSTSVGPDTEHSDSVNTASEQRS